jgi:ribonucleoside-triphosphate reductase
MEISNQILSDVTVYMKYSRYIPELQRRETWQELVSRNMEMHIKKYPELETEIREKYQRVYDKMILPSMRSLQFGGKPIEISPNRIYNCAYLPIDDWRAFGEVMFLLLGGTGVGFSVQRHHIDKLPEINKPNPNRKRRYLIADSIEGWADAIKVLMKSYFQGGSTLDFDFRDIRAKGTRLITSGGKAPGPQPLKECLIKIEGILSSKQNNEKLTTIEVHDIICHIADAVLAGGIRRAALISLFSADDEDMIACKSGNWWELNPQRGRANNSAVLLRNKITKEFFLNLWKKIEASGAGEPGIYFTNDKDWGTNPCCLTGDTLIMTEEGEIKIEDLVKSLKETGRVPRVWSYDIESGKKELSTIDAGDMTRENAEVIKIELEDGSFIKLTPDHRVYTLNKGYIEAAKLTDEDELLSW